MRKFITLALLSFHFLTAVAQTDSDVKKLVREGIELHDKGDYDGAIKKYDEALTLNADDFDAAYEKSLTCMYLKRHDECIALSKTLVQKFAGNPTLKQVYSNWGSALDDKGEPEEAIKVYNKGLLQFPNHYLLHFNKGLTYARLKKYNEAAAGYKDALKANPLHPSSHYQLASLHQDGNRIASLLAYLTFIVCEPQSERSKNAFSAVQEIVYRNVKKENGQTTLFISTEMLETGNKKNVPDDFRSIELTFSFLGNLDNAKGMDSVANTQAAKFDFKMQMLFGILSEKAKGQSGFFWTQYVPFFSEMKAKGYTGVLSNLVYLSADADAQSWAEQHKEKIGEFYDWLKKRAW